MSLRRMMMAGGSGGPPTDPNFANVVSLLHFNGTDGSTTFTDVTGKTWTPTGDAQIDTAQSKFGGASGLFDGSGDYITATHADFAFGTDDFTIEAWLRRNTSATHNIISWSGNNALYANAGQNILRLQVGGTEIETINCPAVGNWFHVAFCRASGVFYLAVDGVQAGTPPTNTTNFTGTTIEVGRRSGSTNTWNGWVDDFRVTKGVGRYTSNFTPPAAAFPDS